MITRRSLLICSAAAPLSAAGVMDGFRCEDFDAGGIKRPVFSIGSGPAILLLHELPGLMPEDIHMARLLAARAYTVYVPLLFGKPGDGNAFLRDTVLRVFFRTPCWGPRFACASKSSLGTIAAWVAALSLHINSLQGGAGLAVMGNCLTGSLPLALMADASVRPALRCAVLSQPALPLGPWPFPKPLTLAAKTSLGVSESDLRKAAHSGVPVLAFRFIDDPVVPQKRLDALAALFPKDPKKFEFCPVHPDSTCHHWAAGKAPAHHHSVLTVDTCEDESSHGGRARERFYQFLDDHLKHA